MNVLNSLPSVVVIELGSQYTLLIERSLREIGIRSVILDPKRASDWFAKNPVKAVILSGGAASVYDADAPAPPAGVFSLKHPDGKSVPVLGICYGMQWIAKHFGGTVQKTTEHGEYGTTRITELEEGTNLFKGFEVPGRFRKVWASHGDSVTEVPPAFIPRARTASGAIAAMCNHEETVWGVQFHPEVTQTEGGKNMLRQFMDMGRCRTDWLPSSMVKGIQTKVARSFPNGKVIFGFSGGVDSTTLAAILVVVLGNRLIAVIIDGGQLRENELEEIALHAKIAGVTLRVIDARRQFNEVMEGVTDAGVKRRRFKHIYTECFLKEATLQGATAVLQGTLAPDRIESGATGGANIKEHHNVGLDMGHLLQLHPIDHLFKYEVRALAREFGLPPSVYDRQPFPGPGLFLRVVGVPATPDKLDIVRWADARVCEICKRHGVYSDISQLLTAYIGTKTVGVKGDARAYGGAIVVRGVKTLDFMTAEGYELPSTVRQEIKSTLGKHPDIVRVWFDEMDKPPATTEME